MKRKTVKIIAFLSLIILIMSIFTQVNFATELDEMNIEVKESVNSTMVGTSETSDDSEDSEDFVPDNDDARAEEEAWEESESGFLSDVLDGIAGILFYPIKLMILGLAKAVNVITGAVALLGGGDATTLADFSLDKLFFNEVPLVKLDFFNITGESNDTLKILREGVAQWYYILRNLSLVILLGILIYVGIRMAISTVASEEAKYKKMFENWLVSIVLLFLLHYIIIFILTINNSLVDIFASIKDSVLEGAGMNSTMSWILDNCWSISFTKSIGNVAVYTILVGVTLIFLLSYIKRMITVAFLIMISPLIVITYSIDKMGDGKSQALNTWMKEFSYNVLIQPFHCIIYLSLVSTAVKLMQDAPSLGSSVLAIVLVLFIYTAEDIVKNIFGFKANSLAKSIASGAVIGTALSSIGKSKKNGEQGSAKGGSSSGSGGSNSSGSSKIPKMNNMVGENKSNGSNSGGSSGSNTAGVSAGTSSGHSGAGNGESSAGAAIGGGSSSGTIDDSAKPSKGSQILARTAQGAKNIAGKYASASFKLAMAGFGAALGASTGSGNTALIGMHTGANLASNSQQKFTAKKNQRTLKSNQRQFASASKDYQSVTGMDNDQLKARSEYLLNMDDNLEEKSKLTDADREYRDYLLAMKSTYAATGMDDKKSSAAVLDTINAVQDGSIKTDKDMDAKNLEDIEERRKNEQSQRKARNDTTPYEEASYTNILDQNGTASGYDGGPTTSGYNGDDYYSI